MTLSAELFWFFRSPYSYLAMKRYRQMVAQYDLEITLRPVLPIAIGEPVFYENVTRHWSSNGCGIIGRLRITINCRLFFHSNTRQYG